MRNADALLIQSTNQFPPLLSSTLSAREDFANGNVDGFADVKLLHTIGTYGGYPVLSLPIGFSSPRGGAPRGLPVGVQLIGRKNEEETLIRIAYAYQKKFGVVKSPDLSASGESRQISGVTLGICFALLGTMASLQL